MHALARAGFQVLEIRRWEVVYLPRCVTCGAPADDEEDFPQTDWADLVEIVRFAPGWLTTNDLLVFCPYHRPDREVS